MSEKSFTDAAVMGITGASGKAPDLESLYTAVNDVLSNGYDHYALQNPIFSPNPTLIAFMQHTEVMNRVNLAFTATKNASHKASDWATRLVWS